MNTAISSTTALPIGVEFSWDSRNLVDFAFESLQKRS